MSVFMQWVLFTRVSKIVGGIVIVDEGKGYFLKEFQKKLCKLLNQLSIQETFNLTKNFLLKSILFLAPSGYASISVQV